MKTTIAPYTRTHTKEQEELGKDTTSSGPATVNSEMVQGSLCHIAQDQQQDVSKFTALEPRYTQIPSTCSHLLCAEPNTGFRLRLNDIHGTKEANSLATPTAAQAAAPVLQQVQSSPFQCQQFLAVPHLMPGDTGQKAACFCLFSVDKVRACTKAPHQSWNGSVWTDWPTLPFVGSWIWQSSCERWHQTIWQVKTR